MVEIPLNSPNIPGTPSRIPGTPASAPNYGEVKAPTSVHLRDVQGRFTKGGFGFEWQNIQELLDMPETFGGRLEAAAEAKMKKLRDEIETYAKETAPWEDRTGDARAGLKAVYIKRGEVHEIDLGHSVAYGFFLENFNGGALAVIQPTLRHFAPEMAQIADEMESKSEKMGGGFQ